MRPTSSYFGEVNLFILLWIKQIRLHYHILNQVHNTRCRFLLNEHNFYILSKGYENQATFLLTIIVKCDTREDNLNSHDK